MTDTLERLRDALAGKYEIERELGRGGMAIVYLAQDLKHDRKVAVKVLRPGLADALGPERFLREIRVTARLQHPYILPLLDSGDADGSLYYVMPYVEGESLRDRLDRESQLPIEDALSIAIQVARALAVAGRQEIVHRDIKPENILLSGGEAVVADFGVARAVSAAEETQLTGTGLAVGTPAYMSPEQAGGDSDIDARSDQYALACVLFEMLAGHAPFTGQRVESIIRQHLLSEPPSLAVIRATVPEKLARIVVRAMAKSPADRFRTADELAEALAQVSAELTTLDRLSVARPPLRSRKRMLRYAGAAAVAAVLLVAAWIAWQTRPPTAAPLESDRVAVFPFIYNGAEEFSHLGRGMVGLLSTVLEGAGGLRTVDPAAVLATVDQEDEGPLLPERARGVAQRFGAGRYVVGNIQEAGGRVTVSATAYDLASGQELQRAAAEGSANDDLFRLVNDVTVQLLGAFGVDASARRLESISSSSVVALNEYLKGETGLRRGDLLGAITAFQRAVETDSLFALAWYRLAYAVSFTGQSEQVEAPLRKALQLVERLSQRDRRLADALAAAVQADAHEATRLYESLVFDYPDDVDARFGLADVLLHSGPIHGFDMDSVVERFTRVLELDPRHPEALVHLPWAAGLEQDVVGVDSAVARALDAEPDGLMAPVFRGVLAFARNDSASLEAALSELQSLQDDFWRMAVVFFVRPLGDLRRTDRIVTRLFIEPARPPEVRAFGHLVKAHLALGMGRWRAAQAQLAEAARFDPAAALEGRALLTVLPWVPATRDELTALRDELDSWDAAAVPPSALGSPWFAPHDGFHQQARLYLLGLVSARLGDSDAALAYASALDSSGDPSAQQMAAEMLSHGVRAYVEHAAGRYAAVEAQLRDSGLRGWHSRAWERTFSSPIFAQSVERFLRADALEQSGRSDDASRWYSSLWMPNNFDTVFLAYSHLKLGMLAERAGDSATATDRYARFVELWSDADPEFEPLVTDARSRLEQLTADR